MRFRYTPLLLSCMLAGMGLAGAGLRAAVRQPACPRPAAGVRPGSISGLVTDASSRKPLASVGVALVGRKCGTLTDSTGVFRIDGLSPDTYTVRVTRIGYRAVHQPKVRVRAGADTALRVALSANPLQLGQVVVTGAGTNRLGKQARASQGSGYAYNGAMAMDVEAELEEADELLLIEAAPSAPTAAPAPPMRIRGTVRGAKVREGVARGDRRASDSLTASEPPATQGTLRARSRNGKPLGDFPLQHTDVAAEISGSLARTVVEQRYANPYKEVIEAVYIFPLPTLGAVNDFVMRVGSRKIVGLIRTREEAERIYRDARARGQTASLLTQERPNIFTQNVANIEPGGSVTISITYFERLPYEKGEYAFVFPMVVGPRYNPGQTTMPLVALRPVSNDSVRPHRHFGGGTCVPIALRPDTTSINPPVLKPGERSGHDISLSVTLDAGLPIQQLAAVAHHVDIQRLSPTRQVIRLVSDDAIPNRDFVLRWTVAGSETQFGVLAHSRPGDGYFSLTMQPPLTPRDEQVTPREITFILDISGSMMGLPIDLSKGLIERTLDRLRADDAFNLVYFAGGNAQLWDRARQNTPANVAEAKRFLSSLTAGGGTEMLAGVQRALHAHHEPEYLQMYVFLTDGYVGNEEEILRVIKEERGEARFFGFGIGSGVNRYLIDGIGEHGGGMAQVVIPRDSTHATRAVERLFDAIDSPVLVDIAIDWNGLPVRDVYPAKVRDLFAGQVIDVVGRYTAGASGTAYVSGRIGSRRVRYSVRVELPATESRHAALAPVWARLRIHDLSGSMLVADSADRARLRRAITDLALEHRLVSQYTSFVAVDSSRVVGDGSPMRVMQPVELPEGVSYEGIFGERPTGKPARIERWGMTLQETESGKIRVAELTQSGPAASAGIRRGATILALDRVKLNGLSHLEAMLLQSAGQAARLTSEPGGEMELPMP